MEERINSFRELKEDWDSYGAVRPDSKTIDRSLEFWRQCFASEPIITPTVNGNISFEGDDYCIEIGASEGADDFWFDFTE